MNGQQVGSIMDLESRIALDESKTIEQLRIKLNVFDIAFHNFEALQMENSDTNSNIKDERFSFVPFPCGFFVDTVLNAFFILGQDRSKKFLDVGCGIGTKVMLASSLFDAYGIDIEEKYVKTAHDLKINRVGQADAMNFDRYDQFDVIYYYRPIFDPIIYRDFESKIHKESKVGSLIIPMHSEYNWGDQEDIEVLISSPHPTIYRKKS